MILTDFGFNNNLDYIIDMIERQLEIKFSLKERNDIIKKFNWFEVNFYEVFVKYKKCRSKLRWKELKVIW